jgi:FlaA1/EpsC-like NDP-sugar epimerase
MTYGGVRRISAMVWDVIMIVAIPSMLRAGLRTVRAVDGIVPRQTESALVALEPVVLPSAFDWVKLVAVAAVIVFLMRRYGVYRRIWRFASWPDLETLTALAVLAGGLSALAVFHPDRAFWKTFVLSMLTIGTVTGAIILPRVTRTIVARRARFNAARAAARQAASKPLRRAGSNPIDGNDPLSSIHADDMPQRSSIVATRIDGRPRVLIIGVGVEARQFAAALTAQIRPDIPVPAGFITDDTEHHGALILGLPVFGPIANMAEYARSTNAVQVLVAYPNVDGDTLRSWLSYAQGAGLILRTVPSIAETSGVQRKAGMLPLRDLRIEDLLRRPTRTADADGVSELLRGKVVCVTGAGGSIGGELCRQIARAGARQLLLVGRGENSIFEIEQDLRARSPRCDFVPIILDVRDGPAVARMLARWKPEIVFHAAAHKHVPYMETNPAEALSGNVLGTWRVATACADAGIKQFVFVSSDKAVTTANAMGATKRVCELIVRGMATRLELPWAVVRFGNVLGSRGSVVPTFLKQIERGGPVTITDKRMTRYFMTIPEAATLVLEAASIAQTPGQLFMLDMGEPVPIVRLAEDIVRLSGLQPGEDIDIVETGARPGEVLEEQLVRDGEHFEASERTAIFKVVAHDLDEADCILAQLPSLAVEAMGGFRDESARRWLAQLVPESSNVAAQVLVRGAA